MTLARGLRGAAALTGGALWWWAVLRLTFASDAGVLEGAVAAGGWGLSVLPVHCVPKAQAVGALATGRWRQALRAGSGSESGAVPSSGSGSASGWGRGGRGMVPGGGGVPGEGEVEG